jgi:hypothetical protein
VSLGFFSDNISTIFQLGIFQQDGAKKREREREMYRERMTRERRIG